MGSISQHAPVVRLVPVITRHAAALDWARQRASAAWGPVALESPTFDFSETDYYAPTMGADLKKTFLAFARLAEPPELVDDKITTNAWEAEYALGAGCPEERPLNLDPGYLTPAKLVLASTKDHAHRIYLERGIYAEVTLHYQQGSWQTRPWTFPDYRRTDFHDFFSQVRHWQRQQSAAGD